MRFLTVLCVAGTGVVVVALVLLLPSYAVLDSYEEVYSGVGSGKEHEAVEKMNQEYGQKLERTHEMAGRILRKQSTPMTALDALFEARTEGLLFESVELGERKSKTVPVTVRGTAETRADLLAFDERMSNDDRFSGFNLPIEVLTKQEDISFNVTFTYHEN